MDRISWQTIGIPAAYVFLVGLIIVFVHSGLQGAHGLAAYREAGAEQRRLDADLARLSAERVALENKVMRLSDRYLDLELLDERARAVLGLIHTDEIVIR